MLYGHCHGMLLEENDMYSFDVGLDTNNFEPYSLADVKKIMSTKTVEIIVREKGAKNYH